jgi:hypothetical protein
VTYYVAHRLFSLHDRALGALVAELLAAEVGARNVFLPFCDTDEESLASPCKGRTLFELDTRRLLDANGMIAVLHGPSLDDGVCMEIGFAVAAGLPVVVLTTDFQTYGLTSDGPELQFPDPLIEAVVADIVRVAFMAPATSEGEPAPPTRFSAFGERNLRALRAAAASAVQRLVAQPNRRQVRQLTTKRTGRRSAFVESSPYREIGSLGQPLEVLEAQAFRVHRSRRLTEPNGSIDHVTNANDDWLRLSESEVLVVDVSGPETPPGAAMLIGASVEQRRPILATSSRTGFTFAPGREPNQRNLMIEYAVTGWFRSGAELAELLDQR